eukprot:3122988-Pleurochrysis_carterae.AAC.2
MSACRLGSPQAMGASASWLRRRGAAATAATTPRDLLCHALPFGEAAARQPTLDGGTPPFMATL